MECVALVGKLCRQCGWLHYQWGLTGSRPEQVPLKWSRVPASALLCNEMEEGHTLLGVIGRFERLVLSTLCVNLLIRLLAAGTAHSRSCFATIAREAIDAALPNDGPGGAEAARRVLDAEPLPGLRLA